MCACARTERVLVVERIIEAAFFFGRNPMML